MLRWACPARGDESAAAPGWHLAHRTQLGARVNPRGLSLETRLMLSRRLFAADEAPLRKKFFAVGVAPALTPAMWRLGVVAELQPASFLNLWASAERVGYLGTFRQMASFPSATAAYGDDALDARAKGRTEGPMRRAARATRSGRPDGSTAVP